MNRRGFFSFLSVLPVVGWCAAGSASSRQETREELARRILIDFRDGPADDIENARRKVLLSVVESVKNGCEFLPMMTCPIDLDSEEMARQIYSSLRGSYNFGLIVPLEDAEDVETHILFPIDDDLRWIKDAIDRNVAYRRRTPRN